MPSSPLCPSECHCLSDKCDEVVGYRLGRFSFFVTPVFHFLGCGDALFSSLDDGDVLSEPFHTSPGRQVLLSDRALACF